MPEPAIPASSPDPAPASPGPEAATPSSPPKAAVAPLFAQPRWNIPAIVEGLSAARGDWRRTHYRAEGESFPSRARVAEIAADLTGALFPMRLGPPGLTEADEDSFVRETLTRALDELFVETRHALRYDAGREGLPLAPTEERAREIVAALGQALPAIRRLVDGDVEAAWLGDPAARSVDEALICYPGLVAILHHRIAHALYGLGAPLIARIVSEAAHSQTGIDIHPGASIGPSFFIDHGVGVVIGETAVVGARARIYQGVTLGAKSFPRASDGSLRKGLPRHPILEDDVTIYAGATILGRVTIGAGSIIGGNVWLADSVPPGSRIHQAGAVRRASSPTHQGNDSE